MPRPRSTTSADGGTRHLWAASRDPQVRQFLRFCVVGLLQNGVNVGLFALQVAGGVPYLLAATTSACVALALSFVLNRRWTFPGNEDRTATRAIRFVAIWTAILLVGLVELAILVSVAGVPKVAAQAIVIAIGAPISYFAQRRWTFSQQDA